LPADTRRRTRTSAACCFLDIEDKREKKERKISGARKTKGERVEGLKWLAWLWPAAEFGYKSQTALHFNFYISSPPFSLPFSFLYYAGRCRSIHH
jgi:hypothetical protein